MQKTQHKLIQHSTYIFSILNEKNAPRPSGSGLRYENLAVFIFIFFQTDRVCINSCIFKYLVHLMNIDRRTSRSLEQYARFFLPVPPALALQQGPQITSFSRAAVWSWYILYTYIYTYFHPFWIISFTGKIEVGITGDCRRSEVRISYNSSINSIIWTLYYTW